MIGITRGERWLLETAVSLRMPLGFLVHPELELLLNGPPPGLSREELLGALERLIAQGFVRAWTEARGEFIPTRAELSSGLGEPGRRSSPTCYCVTSEGGAAWESLASPNWSRLIDVSIDLQSDDVFETIAICADERWLQRYITTITSENDVEPTSIVFDQVAPWDATYWRQLPLGHRCRFHARAFDQFTWPTEGLTRWYARR